MNRFFGFRPLGKDISFRSEIVIGIDAANIRQGGGVTHLRELLSGINLNLFSIKHIFIWGSKETLSKLPEASWITKINPPWLNKNLAFRTMWQIFRLDSELKKTKCDLLFVPGGSYVGKFSPAVCMNQNLIPFDSEEMNRIKWSRKFLKMFILNKVQSYTLKRVSGVIFLTQYAKKKVLEVVGDIKGETCVIHHGLNPIFIQPQKIKTEIGSVGDLGRVNLLYVSNIAQYKNQSTVLEGCKLLRDRGYPVTITFVGYGAKEDISSLKSLMSKHDPCNKWSKYLGELNYEDLPKLYSQYDIGIFASSCETFGIILLEKMASGLPLVCSNKSCMPEILGDGGLYFDPEDAEGLANSVSQYLNSSDLLARKSKRAHKLALGFSWNKCSTDTFLFLEKIIRNNSK
jgi:glycosyltransferase involved in cell wall biosynthesis